MRGCVLMSAGGHAAKGRKPRAATSRAPTWSDGVTKIVDSFALSLSDQPRTGRVESRALTLGLNGDGTCVAM